MKRLLLLTLAFTGLVSAQTTFCVSTGPLKVVPCTPASVAWGSITGTLAAQTDLAAAIAAASRGSLTLAQILPLLPTVPISGLPAGTLYLTLDQVNAMTFCVAGTQTPGCPSSPVAAAKVPIVDATGASAGTTPQYAFSAQAPDGTKSGPAFWVPISGNGFSSNPK